VGIYKGDYQKRESSHSVGSQLREEGPITGEITEAEGPTAAGSDIKTVQELAPKADTLYPISSLAFLNLCSETLPISSSKSGGVDTAQEQELVLLRNNPIQGLNGCSQRLLSFTGGPLYIPRFVATDRLSMPCSGLRQHRQVRPT